MKAQQNIMTVVNIGKGNKKMEKEIIDNVNHPKHYKECSIECFDNMLIIFGADAMAKYCCINAYKYLFRYKSKNGFEDLKKARWYMDKYYELLESNENVIGFENADELNKTLLNHTTTAMLNGVLNNG
jgi:hypothetical protein